MGSFKKIVNMFAPKEDTKVTLDGSVCTASKGDIKVEFKILSPDEIKMTRNNAYQYISLNV